MSKAFNLYGFSSNRFNLLKLFDKINSTELFAHL